MYPIDLAFVAGRELGAGQSEQHAVTGMVLKVDRSNKTMIVSCESIPGYMEAMTMPFSVRDAKALDTLQPGATVEFTWVVDKDSSYADNVQRSTVRQS